MNINEALDKIKEWEFKTSVYDLVFNTVYFDTKTIAPKDGFDYRQKRLNYLEDIAYDLKNDKSIISLVDELSKEQLDEINQREIALLKKNFDQMKLIPKDFYLNFSKDAAISMEAWEKAKTNNDYKLFEPHLIKMIKYTIQMAKYISDGQDLYDVLLDNYEEGMNQAKYDEFFELIKKELVPLIRDISRYKISEDRFIYNYYPKDLQAKLMDKINEFIGFDSSWGYMGVSMHPFTSGFNKNDVRVTTFYDEHNISSSIYSIIHEVGHAYYEHQVSDAFDGTIIAKAISSGMHESQSRLFENYLGRTKAFIANFYPYMQELFNDNLKDISLDDFIKGINTSRPSLIRTDADELTYPIHILIRYEMEKGIMNGSISLENLNETWNDYYEQYLGIRPNSDTTGILQDIHWSDASFGYFPTYALGSAVAAQIFNTMNKQIDVDKEMACGNFKAITDWLKDNIQKYAALYPLDELLLIATGEKFNPKYYIEYLKNKYQINSD